MRLAIYTCVVGGYDKIRLPKYIDDRIDYHCWTDTPELVPETWVSHDIKSLSMNAKDVNRYIKINIQKLSELRGYDYTVYVDGSIELVGDVYEVAEDLNKNNVIMGMYDHPFRKCLYDEAIECAKLGHVDVMLIKRQLRKYLESGYPKSAGLYECNVIFRKNEKNIEKIMEMWWGEYKKGAKRDQISIPWVAWINNFKITSLGKSDARYDNKYLILHSHSVDGRKIKQKMLSIRNRFIMYVGC
ncbi:MAG: DUF616 domain-containing protein [Bacteroidetes bacterium]|nr:DUF616 domain-containing protein [Bacteroidota bacterium]